MTSTALQAIQRGDAALPSQLIHPYQVSRTLRLATDHRALCADPAFIASFIDEVGALVERKQLRALSFDVFDTALLRAPHSEAHRFHTVSRQFAQRHADRFSVADALVARASAARAAYAMATPAADGTREGTLDQIAALTCDQLGCAELAADYIATELACEEANLAPNPLMLGLLRAWPEMPVIFLSDMYLGAPRIAPLLQRHYGADVRVMSSADGAGSKRQGGLYQHAATVLGLHGSQILHFGDSLESDFRQAKRNGWNAFYLPLPDAERHARQQCHAVLASTIADSGVALDALLSFNC